MREAERRVHPLLKAYLYLIAAILLVVGLLLVAGGVWLVTLGGSWYYLPAGVGLVASSLFLFRRHLLGFWIYLIVFASTVAWALWERGFDGWAQVPRLVAPTVILLLISFALPALKAGFAARRVPLATSTVVLAACLTVLAERLVLPTLVFAQQDEGLVEPAPLDPSPSEPSSEASRETSAPAVRPPETTLQTGADWPAYGGTYHATRYTPLDQITRENVGNLQQIWQFRTGDMPKDDEGYSPENTPLKVGDRLFVCSAMGIVIGVDAMSGREEWRHDPGVSTDAIPYGATCRGVAYYEVPDSPPGEHCATRILWGTLDARLIAVDAVTGQLCTDFGVNGEVNLEEGLGPTVPGWYAVTSPPTIVRGIAVVGAQVRDNQHRDAPSGVVRGYDAVTGELAWAWDLGKPGVTEAPPEGEVYTRGTPNMWTIASGDEELGHVYLPMGNSSVDYYGSARSDVENEFATALVALDVTTGQPAWHFQTVYHDVWDYDLGSQATLVDFPIDGRTVPALILPSKQGDMYVLDRRTGESLFAVEERRVPQGGVEPEYLSPVQPFSTYHTLARRNLTEEDMWGMSPLDQLWCRIQFRRAHYEGMYTPPTTDRHWIQYPGYNGGSDWGGIAVDPERGIIVANYNDMPNYNRLLTRAEADERGLAPISAPGDPSAPERRPEPHMQSRSMQDGVENGRSSCASNRPMAESAQSNSLPERLYGTDRSARRAGTGPSASRPSCPSTSALRTMAAQSSLRRDSSLSPRPPTIFSGQ